MTCRRARGRFSARRDGELGREDARRLSLHLERCPECAAAWLSFETACEALADVPRLHASDAIAARVFDRLDMEARQPGLALLFRSFWAARPLIVPSLIPAVFVLVAVVGGAIALDGIFREEPLPVVKTLPHGERAGTWEAALAPSGTESNPLFPSAGVSAPRMRSGDPYPLSLLDNPGEGTMFLETVVARDGSVSAVNLLQGDVDLARPVVEALRRERYEPGRLAGRPVAVSIYRLISRVEVRPLT